MTWANWSPTKAWGNGLTDKTFVSQELIFEDDFERFDAQKWTHEPLNAAHRTEFQLYTKSARNSYVDKGLLHVLPTTIHNDHDFPIDNWFLKNNFYPIRSAKLTTRDNFSFKYGTVEIKAKLPAGDWLWPALWLMPSEPHYGPWPVSGEIDLVEGRGNKNLTDAAGNLVGVQQIGSTLHWGPDKSLDKWNLTHFIKRDLSQNGFSDDFHVFKLLWTPDHISFYLDGEEFGSVTPPEGGFWQLGNFTDKSLKNPWSSKMAPFDQYFHLIINLAVGGRTFFSDTCTNAGGKPWNNSSPDAASEFWDGRQQWMPTWGEQSHFLIDYVRVWAL